MKSSGIAGDPQCLLHTADHRDLPWPLPHWKGRWGVRAERQCSFAPMWRLELSQTRGGHQVTCYTLQEAVPLTLEELLLKVNNGKRRENPKESVVTHGCNSSVWEAKVGRLL